MPSMRMERSPIFAQLLVAKACPSKMQQKIERLRECKLLCSVKTVALQAKWQVGRVKNIVANLLSVPRLSKIRIRLYLLSRIYSLPIRPHLPPPPTCVGTAASSRAVPAGTRPARRKPTGGSGRRAASLVRARGKTSASTASRLRSRRLLKSLCPL